MITRNKPKAHILLASKKLGVHESDKNTRRFASVYLLLAGERIAAATFNATTSSYRNKADWLARTMLESGITEYEIFVSGTDNDTELDPVICAREFKDALEARLQEPLKYVCPGPDHFVQFKGFAPEGRYERFRRGFPGEACREILKKYKGKGAVLIYEPVTEAGVEEARKEEFVVPQDDKSVDQRLQGVITDHVLIHTNDFTVPEYILQQIVVGKQHVTQIERRG